MAKTVSHLRKSIINFSLQRQITKKSGGRLRATVDFSRQVYQKDLANRDRVSYIKLMGHRIQDGSGNLGERLKGKDL